MVNVMKGVLIECDPAMKQFLLHLDEKVSYYTKLGNFLESDLPTLILKSEAEIMHMFYYTVDIRIVVCA